MMKKKIWMVGLFIVLVLGLVLANRYINREEIDNYTEASISVVVNDKTLKTLTPKEIQNFAQEKFTFTALKKNKEEVKNEYIGVAIGNFAKAVDMPLEKINGIKVAAVDNFMAEVSKEELLQEQNVYIAIENNDASTYTLVVRSDNNMSRCVRNVTRLEFLIN